MQKLNCVLLVLLLWKAVVLKMTIATVHNDNTVRISSVKHPNMFLTAGNDWDLEALIPAKIKMLSWEELPQQMWKLIQLEKDAWYLAPLENDFNEVNTEVLPGDKSAMKLIKFKVIDFKEQTVSIVDLNSGVCLQYRKPSVLRNLWETLRLKDAPGLKWETCDPTTSAQQWKISKVEK